MEDRFKFRFFDKISKEMCYPTEYNGKAEYIERRYDLADMFRFKDLIPMQCTGLKDKNGKLIYEGDMLKTDLKRPYNIVVFRNGMFMVECEHTTGIYYDLFCGVCDDLREDIYSVSFEIIGNIYENKELLEGK